MTKVAHVITRMILGGAQENTLLSVEGLKYEYQYQVDLITGPETGPEGSLLDRCRQNKVPVIKSAFLRRNLNPLFDLLAFFELLFIFKKNKYDIVHTHSSKAGIIGRLAAKAAGVQIIVHTIHGLPFHEYEKPYKNFLYIVLERFAARFTDKIAVVCPEMSRKALAAGIGTDDLYETVYSGIEIGKFEVARKEVSTSELRARLGIPADALVVGKIARLFHLKGYDRLLPIAEKICEMNENVYFLFVGDGILRSELEAEVKRLGISDRVIFAGLVPSSDVAKYISIMDIVVHLSLREGLPRVIPEAFLCSKPVVVYDIDGAKDIVDDGLNGYLVPSDDDRLFIERLNDLVRSKDKRQNFGNNGFKKANELFPAEKMSASLNSMYCRLLSVL